MATTSQPSFWQTNLPKIRRRRFALLESQSYHHAWQKLTLSLPSSLSLRSLLTSLFASLEHIRPAMDTSKEKRALVKSEAQLLTGLLGNLNENEEELWEMTTSLILSRDWEESYARIFVCWVAGSTESQQINIKGSAFCCIRKFQVNKSCCPALRSFLELVIDAWSTPEHIKHSLLSRHRCKYTLVLSNPFNRITNLRL